MQGLAAFGALATFFGRIYFLKYYETLGIPPGDAQLNVIEYSVISPDVAIAALGISGISVAYLWGVSRRTLFTWSKTRFAIGIILVLIGSFGSGFTLLRELVPGAGFGGLGVWSTVAFAVFVFGAAIALSSLVSAPFLARSLSHRASRRRAQRNASDAATTTESPASGGHLMALAPLVFVIFILVVVNSMANQSARFAELNARHDWRNAPLAKIDLTEPNGGVFSRGSSADTQGNPSNEIFRVLVVGKTFVYVRPVVESCICPDVDKGDAGQPKLYAVPTHKINRIEYIYDQAGR